MKYRISRLAGFLSRSALRDALVVALLFSSALWFRHAIRGEMLNRATIGSLWVYEYGAATALAAGFGLVHGSPATLDTRTPADMPIPLASIQKRFDPVRLDAPMYPSVFRVPGYAIASALTMKMTGTTSVVPLIDLQIVIDSLAPIVVFFLLRPLVGGGWAPLGGMLTAFWYPQAVTSSIYYATAPVPFLLSLSLWCYVRMVLRPGLRWAVAFAGIWTAILFLRSELTLIPMLLAVFAWAFPAARQRPWLTLVPPMILVSALAGWTIRNAYATGTASLTSQSGAGLWEGMGYASGLFPQFEHLDNDNEVTKIPAAHGIELPNLPGHFFDGPKGMVANRVLTTLFVEHVLRAHFTDYLIHFAFKLRENYAQQKPWIDALNDFGRGGYARTKVAAGWLDALLLLLPFLALALIRWREPQFRVFGAALLCVAGLQLALAIILGGPLRYIATISPCYPILIAGVLAAVAARGTTTPPATPPTSRLPMITVAFVVFAAIAVNAQSWPRAATVPPAFEARNLPIESLSSAASGTSFSLTPANSTAALENFALHQRVRFAPAPYYPGITTPGDAEELTDGQVDPKGSYTQTSWVGWGMHAPRVFIVIPLGATRFVRHVRVHVVQRAYPISVVQVWETSGPARRVIASLTPQPTESLTAWLDMPVNENASEVTVDLAPTDISQRFIFVDEIQVLGTNSFEPTGTVITAPVSLTGPLPGPLTADGDFPPGTSAEVAFRAQGANGWQTTGWNAERPTTPIQFKVTLHASPDGRSSPRVAAIRFGSE